jgi:hypothetical protein
VSTFTVFVEPDKVRNLEHWLDLISVPYTLLPDLSSIGGKAVVEVAMSRKYSVCLKVLVLLVDGVTGLHDRG